MSYTPRSLRQQVRGRDEAFRLQDLIIHRRNYDLLMVIARGVNIDDAREVEELHQAGILVGSIPHYQGEVSG